MAAIQPKVWKVGNCCTVHSLMATIEEIVPSVLGICMYKVRFVDSRDTDVVPKHSLHEIEGFDSDEDFSVNMDIPEQICASDSARSSEPTQYARFLNVSEEDIDNVARSRLSQRTEYQTGWAVNLFKGRIVYNVTIACFTFII